MGECVHLTAVSPQAVGDLAGAEGNSDISEDTNWSRHECNCQKEMRFANISNHPFHFLSGMYNKDHSKVTTSQQMQSKSWIFCTLSASLCLTLSKHLRNSVTWESCTYSTETEYKREILAGTYLLVYSHIKMATQGELWLVFLARMGRKQQDTEKKTEKTGRLKLGFVFLWKVICLTSTWNNMTQEVQGCKEEV